MKSEKTSEKQEGPGPVIRILVKRKDGRWKVVQRIHVPKMTIPVSSGAPTPSRSGRIAGFWFEAVDREGKILYRRILRTPQKGVEIFDDDGTTSRVDVKRNEYSTELLIPDIPEIESVHLFLVGPGFIPTPERVKKAHAVEPVAIFSLRESEPLGKSN
jgi:hypothetical protein